MGDMLQGKGLVDHDLKAFRVPSSVFQEIFGHMQQPSPRKIAAIKLLRSSTSCGLREAKVAIEKKFRQSKSNFDPEAYDILPLVLVKSITVNMGQSDENITVDLEGLHMLTLMNMNKIGLNEVQHLIDLYNMISEWQSGGPTENA